MIYWESLKGIFKQLKGSSRSKKANLNIVAIAIIKGVSMLISFLYVPLLLNSLNPINYGIWLTLTSLVSWLSLFDIGLGNGLRNKLSEALAQKDITLSREYISTAYGFLSISVFGLVLFYFYIHEFLDWSIILNVKEANKDVLNKLVLILIATFGAQIVLGLINSILYSLQMPAFSSLISMIGQLFSFFIVFVLVNIYQINSLIVLGGVISIIPPFVMLVFTFILFSIKYKEISPSVVYFRPSIVKEIMSLGVKFFVLQISVIFIYQTNNLIISRVLGPKYVAEYNIAYKYIYLVYVIFSIFIIPIWSATTEAYVKKDFEWIKKTIEKLKVLFIGNVVIIGLMIIVAPKVYEAWLGEDSIKVSLFTNIAMGISAVAQMYYGIYGYVINGIGRISLITLINVIFAIIYVPFCAILAKSYGIVGVCIAGSFVNMILGILANVQSTKLLNQTAKGILLR